MFYGSTRSIEEFLHHFTDIMCTIKCLPLVSLTTYDLCSIITHYTPYAQLINAFWSNHGFSLNLANDPSVTFYLKRGTVYPSN